MLVVVYNSGVKAAAIFAPEAPAGLGTCTAFNADFDGDQMAVHVPLSFQAQAEARIRSLHQRLLQYSAHAASDARRIRALERAKARERVYS